MEVTSRSITDGEMIPDEFAFGVPDPEEHVTAGENRSPHLAWTDVPEGTRSFAVICVDPDVPAFGDGVNQEGRVVEAERERTDFYHWVLVDVPPSLRELEEGLDSEEVVAGGKAPGQTEYGVRGVNDYSGLFEGHPEMDGNYGGYDGPRPPWNDEKVHHYHFRVYALDVPTLGLHDDFTGVEAVEAVEGHMLDWAEIVGTYTLNPELR